MQKTTVDREAKTLYNRYIDTQKESKMNEAKVVNYTDAQAAQLANDYLAQVPVEKIAETTGRSVRSVIAKLVQMNVYVSPTKAKGASAVTKLELIFKIAQEVGLEPEVLASLQKADKAALQALADKVVFEQ